MKNLSLDQFTKDIASSKPAPGGGGAAALCAAVGVSLGNMVGQLTTGKKKYAEYEEIIQELLKTSEEVRVKFLDLIEQDAKGFEPLAKAYSIPKDDPSRDAVMEEALNEACKAPLEIMRACSEGIVMAREFAEKGSVLAKSDAGCSAKILYAAMDAASLNVYINTKAMKDRENAEKLNREADYLLSNFGKLADEVFEAVKSSLR